MPSEFLGHFRVSQQVDARRRNVNGRLSGGVLMIVALTASVLNAAESVDPRRATVTVRIFDQIGAPTAHLHHE